MTALGRAPPISSPGRRPGSRQRASCWRLESFDRWSWLNHGTWASSTRLDPPRAHGQFGLDVVAVEHAAATAPPPLVRGAVAQRPSTPSARQIGLEQCQILGAPASLLRPRPGTPPSVCCLDGEVFPRSAPPPASCTGDLRFPWSLPLQLPAPTTTAPPQLRRPSLPSPRRPTATVRSRPANAPPTGSSSPSPTRPASPSPARPGAGGPTTIPAGSTRPRGSVAPQGSPSPTARIAATWVAGTPGHGALTLTVENAVSSMTMTIATQSFASRHPPRSAVNLVMPSARATGYAIDLTPLTAPAGTYYAAFA